MSAAPVQDAEAVVNSIYALINLTQQYEATGREFCKASTRLSSAISKIGTYSSDKTFQVVGNSISQFSMCLSRHVRSLHEQVITTLAGYVRNTVSPFTTELNKATSDPASAEEFSDHVDQFKHMGLELLTLPVASIGNMVAFMCSEAHGCMKDLRSELNKIHMSRRRSASTALDVRENALGMAVRFQECVKARANMSKTFTGTTALEHEGHLDVKEKKWKKRACKIRRNQFYICKIDSQSKVRNKISLVTTTAKKIGDDGFQLITPNETFEFRAGSPFDRDQWTAIIANNVAYCLSGEDEKRASVMPHQFEQNRLCADCGAENPTWCCINWGTCICIQCSGVHRSLTSSVSKVRSMTMDKLDALTMELFSVIGNVNANKVLEEKPIDHRIKPDTEREERRQFIADKYKDRKYIVVHDGEPSIRDAIKSNDHLKVYEAICHNRVDIETLHYAACVGDALTCLMVALNVQNVDQLDSNGWSALSYAGYYGNFEGAKGLLAAGCSPNAAPEAHPYETAEAKQNERCMVLFSSSWDFRPRSRRQFEPLIKI